MVLQQELLNQFQLMPMQEEADNKKVDLKEIQQDRFAQLLAVGANIRDAGKAVGVSPATAYRWYPKVKDKVEQARSEVREYLLKKLIVKGDDAVDVITEIMGNETIDPKVRLSAANSLLDRIGMRPNEIVKHIGDKNQPIRLVTQVELPDNAAESQAKRARNMTIIEAEVKSVQELLGNDSGDLAGNIRQLGSG